ncbi:MAG: T9SS type A sorting domain-containing protein [Bacteroidota bacterium]
MNTTLSSLSKWLLLLIGFSPVALLAQVQGTALLAGQTDHSGITVSFTSTSTSGQSDSTTTLSDGSYSIGLQAGVYLVKMTAPNYQTVFYNQNQAVLLSGNDSLASVSLNPGNVQYISGNVSGLWSSDTIYIANGDLTLGSGASLTIEPGTQIFFEPDLKMTIEGQLDAIGTSTQPITFSVQSINPGPERWEGLKFVDLEVLSQMEYCVVEYANTLISTEDGFGSTLNQTALRLKVSNSTFRFCNYGIVLDTRRRIELYNNEFSHFDWYGIGVFGRILSHGGAVPGPYSITCNKIHDGNYAGIYGFQAEFNAYIAGNEVYDMPQEIGMRFSRSDGTLTVENNVIRNCGVGIADGSYDNAAPALYRNNLLLENGEGIRVTSLVGPIIQMNAIVDNAYGLTNFNSATITEFAYNLLSQNDTSYRLDNPIPFLGENITVNANGDSTDAYFNFEVADALLDSSYLPQTGSPLINAGNPNTTDADGSIRDIGLSPDSLNCWAPQSIALPRPVFPGDANFDQIANVWDLLPIGLKYGQTGPARPNASLNWVQQDVPDWGDSLASGVDIKHADCDGNGVIDAVDTLAILQNYNLTHNVFKTSSATGGVPLYMNMPTTQNPGDTLVIPIMLGKVDTLANNVYGLAFSMTYDSSLVEPQSVEIQFNTSWLGTDNVDLLSLYHDEFSASTFEVGLVRTDGMEVSGYGQIGTVIVVLDDDIAKREIPFSLSWQAVDMIHFDESPILANAQDAQTNIETSTTSLDSRLTPNLLLYPNPAPGEVTVRLAKPETDVLIQVYDLQGKLQKQERLAAAQGEVQLSLEALPEGMYYFRAYAKGQLLHSQKLMID